MSAKNHSIKVLFAGFVCAAACDEDAADACTREPGTACVLMGTGVAGLGEDDVDPRRAELYLPQDVTVGPNDSIYVVDWNNHRIRIIEDGISTTLIGTGYLGEAPDGEGREVSLNHPTHLVVAPDGKLIISAWHNSKILSYDPQTGWLSAICGDGRRAYAGDGGPAKDAVLDLPVATALGSDGSIYIADQANQRIRRISPDGMIDTVVGSGAPGFSGDGGPARDASLSLPGGQAAPPAGRIAVDRAGNLYIADTGNHRIRRISADGIITTVAGDGTPAYRGDGGPATSASLSRPSDVVVDRAGALYIADTDNSCVRKVDAAGVISTVAGICGSPGHGQEGLPGPQMALDRPYGLDIDDDGTLYIADTHNHRVVVVHPE